MRRVDYPYSQPLLHFCFYHMQTQLPFTQYFWNFCIIRIQLKSIRNLWIYYGLTVEFLAGFETVQLGITWKMLPRASHHWLWAALGEELCCCFLHGKEMHKAMHEEKESLCPGWDAIPQCWNRRKVCIYWQHFACEAQLTYQPPLPVNTTQ